MHRTRSDLAANKQGSIKIKIRSISRIPNRIMILLIAMYQKALSPWLPPSCRFVPTCSAYGKEAFQRYNFFRALGLTIWRVLRCNPFNPGGYDPLP